MLYRKRNSISDVAACSRSAKACWSAAPPAHLMNDGAAHRRAVGGLSHAVYLDLRRRGWPTGYGLLCANCNYATQWWGVCHGGTPPTQVPALTNGRCNPAYSRWVRWKLRLETITRYGGSCRCCQEDDARFLVLDHPKRNGYRERVPFGGHGGWQFYAHLKQRGWPDGYSILCANCNGAMRLGRRCPHGE
jgi:hypothetical protein